MRYLFGLVLLLLAACGGPEVDVVLTEPLPVGDRDLPRFAHRHSGIYVQPADTTQQLEVLPTVVRRRQWLVSEPVSRKASDYLLHEILALKPLAIRLEPDVIHQDSLRACALFADTIFRVDGPAGRLRHRGHSYYLNRPIDTLQIWKTLRLEIRAKHASLLAFTNDTARLTERGLPHVFPRLRRHYVVKSPKGRVSDDDFWQPYAAGLSVGFEWRRPSGRTPARPASVERNQ